MSDYNRVAVLGKSITHEICRGSGPMFSYRIQYNTTNAPTEHTCNKFCTLEGWTYVIVTRVGEQIKLQLYKKQMPRILITRWPDKHYIQIPVPPGIHSHGASNSYLALIVIRPGHPRWFRTTVNTKQCNRTAVKHSIYKEKHSEKKIRENRKVVKR